MAKKKAKPVRANPWPARLKALQERLGLSNDGMAQKLGIKTRTYFAWKYGQRQPQTGSITLIQLIEAAASKQ